MLVISRKANEQLRIGDDIIVKVVEVSGSSVRLGIEAPRSVTIHREEIWQAIQEENQKAAKAPAKIPGLE